MGQKILLRRSYRRKGGQVGGSGVFLSRQLELRERGGMAKGPRDGLAREVGKGSEVGIVVSLETAQGRKKVLKEDEGEYIYYVAGAAIMGRLRGER